MPKIKRNPNLGGVRVGLIIPSVNTTIEPEFARMAPEGLRAMNAEVSSAARLLASVSPKAVAYACTSGSFLEGAAALKLQIAEIGAITACPVVATSAVMIDALRALGLSRIALATPYLEVLNRIEKQYLESQGFSVVSVHSLGLSVKGVSFTGRPASRHGQNGAARRGHTVQTRR